VNHEEVEKTEIGEKMLSKSQQNANYANARRRPSYNRKFQIGDEIVTRQNRKAKIVDKVGMFSYKLDNGFCVNARNIRYIYPK
jgi:hypothetical protein